MNDLTDNQVSIVKAMIREAQGTGYAPDELLWGHRTFERVTSLDYQTISREMKGLREAGLVYYARGGMNEDGEVCGSGNGLTSEGYEKALSHFSEDELWGEDE